MSDRHMREIALDSHLTLHCEFSGQGPVPIIFIPGWSMSSAVFERQLDHFALSAMYTAVSYDPRGQGRSSKPLEGHYYAQRGRDLGRLLDALGFNEVVLAGWSYGVLDMLAYVQAFGVGRIRAAIIIDGAPRGLGSNPAMDWVWESPEEHIKSNSILRTLENRVAVNRGLAKWCLESTDEKDLRWLEAITNETPDTIAALINEAAIYSDYEAELMRLCAERPVLILCREDWRTAVTRWTEANAVSARREFFGKHMMFWDRAEQFNASLDGFLSGILR